MNLSSKSPKVVLDATQSDTLDIVGKGISGLEAFIAEATNFHGGPVTTEYLLTAEIAKQLIRDHRDAQVEYLINKISRSLGRDFSKPYSPGKKRFDIAVMGDWPPVPNFVIEIKIGVTTLHKLKPDIAKICEYFSCLELQYARAMIGAVLFQVHLNAKQLEEHEEIVNRVSVIERAIFDELNQYAELFSNFEFDWHSFQEANSRVQTDEVETDIDGSTMLGRLGHATRFHTILIKRKI